MSTEARIAEDDWTGRPATKGDLMLLKNDLGGDLTLLRTDLELVKADLRLVKADLENKIDRVDRKIDLSVANLEVKMAEGHRSQARTTWMAVATLGAAVGILLQFF